MLVSGASATPHVPFILHSFACMFLHVPLICMHLPFILHLLDRERERERKKERKKERQTDRKKERKTEREREREKERGRKREGERASGMPNDMVTAGNMATG